MRLKARRLSFSCALSIKILRVVIHDQLQTPSTFGWPRLHKGKCLDLSLMRFYFRLNECRRSTAQGVTGIQFCHESEVVLELACGSVVFISASTKIQCQVPLNLTLLTDHDEQITRSTPKIYRS